MIVKRIEVLEPQLANKIAAGEVVERPASVVKELVENSLDAGSTAVTVEIRDGGTEYIRVTDNGSGINAEDVKTAFLRHATSKLRSVEGLDGIETLGFRGEALASIAAVSRVSMRTRTEDAESGTLISLEGGTVRDLLPCGCPIGTNIEIRELFFNVPARLKFLKNPRAEAAAVGDYMLRLILGNTDVSFKFINNGKPVYHSAGDGSVENALLCVYGNEIAEHVKRVYYDDGYVLIDGYCGDEYITKSNRIQQSIFVNGRYIRSQQLSYAAQRAYNTRIMVGKFPFLMLRIRISPREVDVNVHPNKLTVRFRDEDRITNAVTVAVRDALEGNTLFESSVPEPDHGSMLTASDVYEVFRNGRNSTVPETVRSELFEDAASKPSVPNESVFLASTEGESGKIYVRDSASSEQAAEIPDVNGVIHYTFPKPAPVIEKAEPLDFGVLPYTVIGALFDTYIIVEQGDEVFLIDQHAAHERILYERLIKDELKFDSQLLLSARVLTLSPTDHACVIDNIERFRELGFEIEEFGASSVSVHAIPAGVRKESVEKLVHEMIDVLNEKGSVQELDLVRSSLIRSSCKHAVKGGDHLDKHGIDDLLGHYADGSTPLTCPHGRPVMVRFKKRDFEKMFKRIQ